MWLGDANVTTSVVTFAQFGLTTGFLRSPADDRRVSPSHFPRDGLEAVLSRQRQRPRQRGRGRGEAAMSLTEARQGRELEAEAD